MSRQRNGLGMISGRVGDDATRAEVVGELRDKVVRPPKLEGPGPLKRFELEPDVGTQLTTQYVRRVERCTHGDRADPLPGLLDSLELD